MRSSAFILSNLRGSSSIDGCEFDHNYSLEKGAAMRLNGPVTFEGALTKMYHNEAVEGGAIWCEVYKGTVTYLTGPVDIIQELPSCLEVYNNKAKSAGGIGVSADNLTLKAGSTFKLELNGAKVYDNEAENGAGIYVVDSKVGTDVCDISVELLDGKIYNNKAAANGGGLYTINAPLTVKGVAIYNNTAVVSGAGLCYVGTEHVSFSGGTISSNVSNGNGGGIYAEGPLDVSNAEVVDNVALFEGGGIYASGSVNLNGGLISKNQAANGAGLYTAGTELVTLAGGNITDNVATTSGGGAYLTSSVLMSGVKLENNKAATNGGGAYVTGAVEFTSGTIVGNKAADGAGVYVTDGGVMSYNNGGKITGNEASHHGGGVYLASGADASHVSTLDISFTPSAGENFGLFNNTAALVAGGAGDDIYAEAGNTKMTVPDISAMTLEGYSHSKSKLAWYEDYENNDANYADGTVANTESGYSPRRYRSSRDSYDEVFAVTDAAGNPSYYGKYLALTMGFEYRGINIRRKGLEPGENAVYCIHVYDTGGTLVRTQYVVVKGTEAEWDGTHLQIDGIEAGSKVTVDETSWTWYNTSKTDESLKSEKTVEAGKGLVVFSFENTHAEGTPMHDEDIKDNTLK